MSKIAAVTDSSPKVVVEEDETKPQQGSSIGFKLSVGKSYFNEDPNGFINNGNYPLLETHAPALGGMLFYKSPVKWGLRVTGALGLNFSQLNNRQYSLHAFHVNQNLSYDQRNDYSEYSLKQQQVGNFGIETGRITSSDYPVSLTISAGVGYILNTMKGRDVSEHLYYNAGSDRINLNSKRQVVEGQPVKSQSYCWNLGVEVFPKNSHVGMGLHFKVSVVIIQIINGG